MAEERRTPISGVPIIRQARLRMGDASIVAPVLPEDHGEAVAVLADRIWQIERRLAEGAETFGEVSQAFEKYADKFSRELAKVEGSTNARLEALAPKPTSAAKAFLAFAPLALAVAGLIWAAARYPERGEFLELQRRANDLQTDVTLLKRDVAELLHRLEARP